MQKCDQSVNNSAAIFPQYFIKYKIATGMHILCTLPKLWNCIHYENINNMISFLSPFPSKGGQDGVTSIGGAASAVMQTLHQTVLVKRELRLKCEFTNLTYGPHELWVVTERDDIAKDGTTKPHSCNIHSKMKLGIEKSKQQRQRGRRRQSPSIHLLLFGPWLLRG